MNARIVSTGSYVPENVLTNHDLEKMVETTDEWIIERTGIKERRIASLHQATSDLAYEAATKALKNANLTADDLDLIVVATVTPDMLTPSCGCVLQMKLGATHAVAFDINGACTGFIYALSIAEKFIRTGASRRALVVGAEILSKFTDWTDRTTCVLLADGAGAVILEPSENDEGIRIIDIFSDGTMWDFIHMPAGGSKLPVTEDAIKQRLNFIKMKGNETFKVAVKTLEEIVETTLKKGGITSSQLGLLIPHQANIRIIQAMAKRLELSMEKVKINIQKYGNTSSASIPIALDEAVREGRLKQGDYVMLAAFGAGLTWGSALIKW
ncbi:MAG TPA: beta-ketoacyl-ACP synthase III [Thermodesulfovibrio thiophilus]|uniref:beta-ketoacyl-ACP synthase III n=1 Tax=Thermodesulfovibrio thiophilus TaxID=340095 RepID=UPI00041DD2D9|nr:beta-ketoacyl-ACP synthase III [Thermodesulfovibrio thiophilus]HOA82955.1 beta-ketoacyl-ACP synthase III [Thermodesulfovibrio thiophilus]HQA03702.1 beta-ketoacyl-ACP synthase III [Thermodesulfovibrio thiophilus]HQD35645.1 beta-ketoacyl-ACP synthase III [Thermodesulfovibrio thiophilus]